MPARTTTGASRIRVVKNPDKYIYAEKDGSWRVVIRLRRPDGSMFNREQRFIGSKAEARTIKEQMLMEFNAPVVPVVKPVEDQLTLEQWVDRCADQHWPRRVPTTASKYTQAMRTHVVPVLGKTPIGDLNQRVIREFVYSLAEKDHPRSNAEGAPMVKLAVSTITAIKAALSNCLAIAVEEQVIPSNPASNLKIRWKGMKQTRRLESDREEGVRLMTEAEIQDILDRARAKNSPIYPMLLFQAKMGLRIAEALALRPSDFDVKAKVCRIRRQLKRVKVGEKSVLKLVDLKTDNSRRDIPLPKPVLAYVKAWKGGPDQPFTRNEVGGFLEPRKAQQYWVDLVDKMTPRPTTHDLRGNFVSRLLNDHGVAATTVQTLAGHSNILTTLSYYSKASQKNLVDAMKSIA